MLVTKMEQLFINNLKLLRDHVNGCQTKLEMAERAE